MGIDDLLDEKTERSITSRKDPSNVSIPESAWKEMAANHPGAIYIAAVDADENDARCLAALLEDVLENGIKGWNLGEDQIEDIEYFRDEIVDVQNL